MKKLPYIFAALLVLSGCRKDPQPGGPDMSDFAISFDVQSVEALNGTRSMIETIDDLQTACTPVAVSPLELKESIGIWADYIYLGTTYNDLLSDVQLAYYTREGGNSEGWNYGESAADDEYWQMGGVYYFRAYYPQQAVNEAIVSTSSAETFIVNYNSEVLQEDLMVGYETVDTKTAANLSQPVNVHLKHAMAALRFQFQFQYKEGDVYYDEDALTSCWLRNTDDDGFTTAGMMVYGVTDESGDYYPEQIYWAESYQPKNLNFYYWSDSSGVPFKNVDDGDTDTYDPDDEVSPATAYSTVPTDATEKRYAGNDGWLLVIPQKSDGTVELCFTTQKGGSDNVYSVKLPAVTGTDLSGRADGGNRWIAGYRYTYTISITKTDMELYLSLADWNQLDSSYSITF